MKHDAAMWWKRHVNAFHRIVRNPTKRIVDGFFTFLKFLTIEESIPLRGGD
jgi:hypothetical protein